MIQLCERWKSLLLITTISGPSSPRLKKTFDQDLSGINTTQQ